MRYKIVENIFGLKYLWKKKNIFVLRLHVFSYFLRVEIVLCYKTAFETGFFVYCVCVVRYIEHSHEITGKIYIYNGKQSQKKRQSVTFENNSLNQTSESLRTIHKDQSSEMWTWGLLNSSQDITQQLPN